MKNDWIESGYRTEDIKGYKGLRVVVTKRRRGSMRGRIKRKGKERKERNKSERKKKDKGQVSYFFPLENEVTV